MCPHLLLTHRMLAIRESASGVPAVAESAVVEAAPATNRRGPRFPAQVKVERPCSAANSQLRSVQISQIEAVDSVKMATAALAATTFGR